MTRLDAAVQVMALLSAISDAIKANPDAAQREAEQEVLREIETVEAAARDAIVDAGHMSRDQLDARLEHHRGRSRAGS